jgi:hypothetical protein
MSAVLTSFQVGEVFLLRTTATNPSTMVLGAAFGWLKLHDSSIGSGLVGSTMPHQWHMLSSSVTEEYDHAGSSEFDPDAS